MKDYVKKLKSLGDETRIRILKLIIEASQLYVCDIVSSLNLPFYCISRHIKELKNAGILEEQRDGKFIKYFLKDKNDKFIYSLINFLNSVDDEIFKTDKKRMKNILRIRKRLGCKLL
ncbi:MAG: metalloregulator ArsR/SmtB family transcription factor [Candidatus Omnitrophica bacterium]|nr:metalloregulator ArsR/SmtB family transcription factor [Candidatus Omnitrophota bacterium]